MNKKKERKGIRLTLLFSVFGFLSLLLTASVLVSTAASKNGYEQINRLTDGYLSCTKDVLQLDETSDFLTQSCREYVAKGTKTAAESYVTEITESQSREKALEHFGIFFANTPVYDELLGALSNSNLLAEEEFYAMRLAADYYGFDSVPSRIQQVVLSEVDAALTKDAKLDLAFEKVFGDEYVALKTKIDDAADRTLDGLIAITSERKKAANDSISATMLLCDIAGGLMLGLIVGLGIATTLLVLLPLRKAKDAIDNGKRLEVTGSREIRFTSRAYNRVYDENEKKKEILLFEVSHDILTGIPNRHDYVDTCNKFAESEVLFIIADVDRFKGINDSNGHSVGDTVLTEVARRLREAFLNHDRVFRIGGDEFVVIVYEPNMVDEAGLRRILEGINTTLNTIHENQKGFPFVSLSFGVARKKKKDTFEEAYRHADKALYSVKEKGGNGVAFDLNAFKN